MYDKILVAIDHSAANKQVFDKALSLAKAEGASLIILHVLSSQEEDSPMMSPYFAQHRDRCIHLDPQIVRRANEIYGKEWSDFERKGIKLLRSFTKKAIAAGVDAEFSQITGYPSSTICDFARSCNADMIVIGRRGHSGLKEILLGSVSNYVVHHAPCSILLVQTPIQSESDLSEKMENRVYA